MKRPILLVAALAAVATAGALGVVWASQAPSGSPQPPTESPGPVPSADPLGWAGIDWENVRDPFPVDDPRPARIDGLGSGQGVLVGWGRVTTPGRNQFNEMGAVFMSTDGGRWRSVALDDGVDPVDTSELTGVAVGPAGMLAYGGVCCGTEERALWRSADGLRWTRVRLAGDMAPRSLIARVVGLPTGWVAVGSSGDRAAIWTSSDGLSWEAVDPPAAGLDIGAVSDVALTDDRLIAVGTIDDKAGTHDGAIWLSDNGSDWTRAADKDPTMTGPDETELWRVIPFAGGLFVVGNYGTHEERVRCEQLLGAIASLEMDPPAETALSCGWGREHHWISSDGSSWRRLPPLDPLPGQLAAPGQRPIEFRLLAAGGPGLVNLAENNVPPDGDSRIWVSSDGIGWEPVDPAFPGPAGSVQAGLAVSGRRIVAVGESTAPGPGVGITIGEAR
jgi:hypothetical protein